MPRQYKSSFLDFMSHKEGKDYSREHSFTTEELLRIKPDDICRWMNARAYGDPAPTEDMKPELLRSSTLGAYKKAVSSFMPLKAEQWDPVTERGNPTRSSAVSEQIKRVEEFEVHLGAQPQARRALEHSEFTNVLSLVRKKASKGAMRYKIGSVLTLQWHLIARIDEAPVRRLLSQHPVPIYPHLSDCWAKEYNGRARHI